MVDIGAFLVDNRCRNDEKTPRRLKKNEVERDDYIGSVATRLMIQRSLHNGSDEPVAYPPLAEDHPGILRVRLEFAAQSVDILLDKGVVAGILRAPYLFQQKTVGQHPSLVLGQFREQVVFVRRQPHRPTRQRDVMRAEIEGQITGRKRMVVFKAEPLRAAEQRGHPGQQLEGTERLGDIVVGPRLQHHRPVDIAFPPDQDEQRNFKGPAHPADNIGDFYPGQRRRYDDEVR
jgi:hypothetical protein